MELQLIKEHFKQRAQGYDTSAHWVKDKELLKIISKLAPVSKTDVVLDVATGTGVVAEIFLKRAKRVIGLDFTEGMFKQAVSKVDFMVNAQTEHLPFKDNSFGLVICRQGLQFMDAIASVLQMQRVCKPRGQIMLIHLVAFGKEDREYAFKIQMARQPVRVNCFLEQDLIDLLKKSACINIKSYAYFSYESINEWIDNGALLPERQEQVRRLYHEAPLSFKKIHALKFVGDDIMDRMKIAIVYGYKNK